MGWNSGSVVPGQQVKVIFCPSRARARGTLLRLILPDGSVLNGIASNFYRGPPLTAVDKIAPPPPLPPLPPTS